MKIGLSVSLYYSRYVFSDHQCSLYNELPVTAPMSYIATSPPSWPTKESGKELGSLAIVGDGRERYRTHSLEFIYCFLGVQYRNSGNLTEIWS